MAGDKPALGEQLAIRSASHYLSADHLFNADVDKAFNGRFSASIYFLASFSIELAFKAIFIARGRTEAQVAAFGHKLDQLLDAYEREIEPLPELLRFAVLNLAPAHRDLYFRYGGSGSIELPDVPVMLAASDALSRAALRENGLFDG